MRQIKNILLSLILLLFVTGCETDGSGEIKPALGDSNKVLLLEAMSRNGKFKSAESFGRLLREASVQRLSMNTLYSPEIPAVNKLAHSGALIKDDSLNLEETLRLASLVNAGQVVGVTVFDSSGYPPLALSCKVMTIKIIGDHYTTRTKFVRIDLSRKKHKLQFLQFVGVRELAEIEEEVLATENHAKAESALLSKKDFYRFAAAFIIDEVVEMQKFNKVD